MVSPIEYLNLQPRYPTLIHLKPIEMDGKLHSNPIYYDVHSGIRFARAEFSYNEHKVLAVLVKCLNNGEWTIKAEARYLNGFHIRNGLPKTEKISNKGDKQRISDIVRKHFNTYYGGLTFGDTSYSVNFE